MTNCALPKWLNTNDPRIVIVPHEDIFENENDLPVFNSNAIEMNLHRIPGLSRHFIYLNDDFIFNYPVTINDFFDVHNNTYKIYVDKYNMLGEVRIKDTQKNKKDEVADATDTTCPYLGSLGTSSLMLT